MPNVGNSSLVRPLYADAQAALPFERHGGPTEWAFWGGTTPPAAGPRLATGQAQPAGNWCAAPVRLPR